MSANPVRLHRELTQIWRTGSGWRRLSSVNHSILGVRFMVTALVFFAIGGVLSMLIRAQLATPDSAFLGPQIYNQIFTMHGTVMMFLFAIPMIEGVAIYLLPKLLGARDFAFPRLTAYGYWCYLFGGTILIVALLAGAAPDSGWFMYTPLSSQSHSPGINSDVWLLGVTFVEISGLTFAVEVVVSVLKMRAPGMSLDRMPIFAWYLFVTAMMMVLGFPPLILGSILLEIERAFGLPFFDPTRGGDALLWQHLFWLFGHPEVYIIFLPAAGALSTIIPVFAQRPLVGYRAIVVAIVGMAFLSFGIWVHHMFTVGIPHLALAFFSAGSALVAVPTSLQFFAWLATLSHGRPRWDVPMLYVFGFFFIFVSGGLTGVMLAMVPFTQQAHDTHFVVAHLHYVLVGGFVFPALAGLYYWMPHVTGRLAVHRLAVPAFWLIFIGFNMTFLLMHLTGMIGMPRRIDTYSDQDGWTGLNLLSSIGGFVLTIGFALVAIDILVQRRFGPRFRRDPWGASTLEWAMPTPPAHYGFASIPSIDRRADQLDPARLGSVLAGGHGFLAHARNGWSETLGVQMTTGAPEQIVILPRATYQPLIAALATGVVVLAMLFKLYPLALAAALMTIAAFVWGAQSTGLRSDHGPLDIGQAIAVPPHVEVDGSPPWWSLVITLIADGALFASLVFGAFYLWLVAPNWPPPNLAAFGAQAAAAVATSLWLAVLGARAALGALTRGRSPASWIIVGLLASTLALAALSWAMTALLPDPREHAYAAVCFVLLGYTFVHSAIGAVFALSNLLRWRAGALSARRRLDLRLTVLWQDYSAATGLVALGLVLVLPQLIARAP